MINYLLLTLEYQIKRNCNITGRWGNDGTCDMAVFPLDNSIKLEKNPQKTCLLTLLPAAPQFPSLPHATTMITQFPFSNSFFLPLILVMS